jgi:hypothetical protein
MTTTNWVTAFTVQGELQAEILRGLLEAQGIPVELSQESAARIYGLGVGPMAEVEIIVPEEKLETAQAIFADYKSGKFEDDADTA